MQIWHIVKLDYDLLRINDKVIMFLNSGLSDADPPIIITEIFNRYIIYRTDYENCGIKARKSHRLVYMYNGMLCKVNIEENKNNFRFRRNAVLYILN